MKLNERRDDDWSEEKQLLLYMLLNDFVVAENFQYQAQIRTAETKNGSWSETQSKNSKVASGTPQDTLMKSQPCQNCLFPCIVWQLLQRPSSFCSHDRQLFDPNDTPGREWWLVEGKLVGLPASWPKHSKTFCFYDCLILHADYHERQKCCAVWSQQKQHLKLVDGSHRAWSTTLH